MSTLLRLQDVQKTYPNGTVAVQGLSLDVGQHEFVSFLGPSGCGKSTALKMIAGLLPTNGGSMTWPLSASEPEIGFVFQEPTLMPWATVFDNVWLPLRLKGQSKAACTDRIMGLLDTVGLRQFANVYPRELSGGMKMRVSIARALATQPHILLMDEPFAALDEMTRFKLNNDLLKLWQLQPFTVIFVTHSVYESVYLSQRIVVMASRPGRVVGQIKVDEAYPRNEAFRTTERYNRWCVQVSGALANQSEHQGVRAGDHRG
jgi:NitT/TauT family transport system ATP-binding protein